MKRLMMLAVAVAAAMVAISANAVKVTSGKVTIAGRDLSKEYEASLANLGAIVENPEFYLDYSSATIRNEMYALEKMGYIEKFHSSSGRTPSAKGYRYYCEHLRDGNVSESLKNSLQAVLDNKIKSIDEVIKASCEILSHMTNLVSVVMGPDENEERLANVQMVQISQNSITAIFVTDKGYVENKTFIVPKNISAKEIVDCVNLLNERCEITEEKGILTLEDIKSTLVPILRSKGISFCYLFGSYAKGSAKGNSDVDLLIDTDITGLDFFNLVEEIRNKLHKKIDLVRLKDLQNGNPIILEILKEGIRLL